MQSQKQQFFANLARVKRVMDARANGPENARQVEQDITSEILSEPAGADIVPPQGLSEFEAAEFVGDTLQGALTAFAIGIGIKPPKQGTYNPLFTTPTVFRAVWRLRQVIDQLGVPYDFYVPAAVDYWEKTGQKRMPRPTQLIHPNVISHVMRAWTGRHSSAQ